MSDDTRSATRILDRGVSRRTLAKGAAWTAPVLVMGTVVPSAAASPCPAPTAVYPAAGSGSGSGWTLSNPASGQVSGGSANKIVSDGGTLRFQCQSDNSSTTAAATVSYSTSLLLTATRTYTFTVTVTSNYGNNNQSQSAVQYLQIIVGGSTLLALQTQPGNTGYQLIPGVGTSTVTTYTFSYTAPSSVRVSYQELFTLPGRGSMPAQDDIRISAPAITCDDGT